MSEGSQTETDRLQTLVHGQNRIRKGRGQGGDLLSPKGSHKGGGQGGDRPHPASPRALAKPVAGHAKRLTDATPFRPRTYASIPRFSANAAHWPMSTTGCEKEGAEAETDCLHDGRQVRSTQQPH